MSCVGLTLFGVFGLTLFGVAVWCLLLLPGLYWAWQFSDFSRHQNSDLNQVFRSGFLQILEQGRAGSIVPSGR